MTRKQSDAHSTIIRAKHDASNEWFLTLRASAQDSRLSFEARGIVWYLLSKPNDWEVQVPDLMREGGIGRDKVKKALIELAKANYLIRPKKFKNKEGKWDWTPYVLYEAPFTEIQSTAPLTEKPLTENQSLENRMTDSQSTLHSTENKTQKQNTEDKEQKQKKPLPLPLANHPDFDRVKIAYERNIGLIVPISAKAINELLNTYPAEWIENTFDEAVEHNKRSLAYCKAILERWQREGREKPVNGNGVKPTDPKAYLSGKYGSFINNDPNAGLIDTEDLTA